MTNKIYIEPPESERKYRRLVALGRELGVPIPQMFLEVKVTMPDGRVLLHQKQRSRSWVRNAYNWLFCELGCVNAPDNLYAAGKLNYKDTGGTVRFAAKSLGNYPPDNYLAAGSGYTVGAGSTAAGILVGSNVGAESFEDYVLLTLIANGTGAGQLSYVASEAYVVSYVAGTKTLSATLVRYMNNNSPGDVTVREVGLVGNPMAGDAKYYVLSSRDHVADIVIPATGQLKVTYVISLVYPA